MSLSMVSLLAKKLAKKTGGGDQIGGVELETIML